MRIRMENINKSFSGVQVLKDAALDLREGEVHALIGENGAGKSTLMKILTGVYTRDSGEVYVNDKPVNFSHPKVAEKAGIVFIYQENNAIKDLTVEANMFLGKEIKKKFGVVDKKEMQKRCRKVFERLGVKLDPRQVMSELSVGQQQMVEIAKALLVDAEVIIMDEPTAALSVSETEILFKVIKQLKSEGISIIYISHRLEEIFEICDRVTVLRDGEYIGTKDISETNMQELVRMMIGREIGEQYPERNAKIGDVKFEVQHLTKDGLFKDVTFQVHSGEVLGVYGLMGAGRTEVMKTIFGNYKKDAGKILIDGKEVEITSPRIAKKHGIGYITEDRKSEGLFVADTIKSNISINNIPRIVKNNFVIHKPAEEKLSNDSIKELNIRCNGKLQPCFELSGGNQQKVVFAKWIANNPDILLLDEPTRGVDVGAKKEIYLIINELAERGAAIIFVSSDMPEVLGMSDRIMVLREGTVQGFLDRDEADQEKIMTLAAGGELAS